MREKSRSVELNGSREQKSDGDREREKGEGTFHLRPLGPPVSGPETSVYLDPTQEEKGRSDTLYLFTEGRDSRGRE